MDSPFIPLATCTIRPHRSRWLGILCVLGGLAAAGCQPSSERFASGTTDTAGPRLTPEMLTQWRPLDPSAFESPHSSAARPTPHTAPAPKTVAAGTLRIPTSWVPPTRSRPWQYVVVHHSATNSGGAAEFDAMHRGKGWDELGYHFVIGNGSSTPDGLVEVGPRWAMQKQGAHAKTDDNRFNEVGVGICLVGDFENQPPSQRQLQSLAVLTAYLMDTYQIPANRVIGHDDTKATACPGRLLTAQLPAIRQVAARAVAQDLFSRVKQAQLASDRG